MCSLSILIAPFFVMLVALVIYQSRLIEKGFARQKRLIAQCDSLVTTLNTTTANLEKSNDTAHELLDEKRRAWGIRS